MKDIKHLKVISVLGLFLGWTGTTLGAILYLEDFDPNAAGWAARDVGEMTVSHNAGNYLQGTFGATFLPQTDAFRADSLSSGGAFTGNYVTPGITQISFDLFAFNVLPSDLFIRIISGVNTFSYQFNPLSVGSWDTYTVNLAWSYGWLGLSEAAFNTALTSVDAIEIQVTRSGSGAQSYYLDNVQTLATILGDPGGPPSASAVPEPATISLFLLIGMLLLYGRKRNWKTAAAG